jgi:hypothetical protein
VKYNKQNGAINFKIELLPILNNKKRMSFVTSITDSGSGIEKQRIPLLFKVFGELKY